MIHGYLGVGKTTFAKKLEAEHSAVRFTHDEWMRALFGDDPPEAQFSDYARRISDLMESLWVRNLQVGVDIVLDTGFWSRAERDRTRDLVQSIGAKCRLYCLTVPDEIAWERIETRNKADDAGLYIAPATYESLKARFEPLGDDEARIGVSDGVCR